MTFKEILDARARGEAIKLEAEQARQDREHNLTYYLCPHCHCWQQISKVEQHMAEHGRPKWTWEITKNHLNTIGALTTLTEKERVNVLNWWTSLSEKQREEWSNSNYTVEGLSK